jgi:WD40 repeat protein
MTKLTKYVSIIITIIFLLIVSACTPPATPDVSGVWYDQSIDNGNQLTLTENGDFSRIEYNPVSSEYDIVLAEGTYTLEQHPAGFNEWELRLETELTRLLGLVDIGDIEALPYEIPNTGGLTVKGIKQSFSLEIDGGELLLGAYKGEDTTTIEGEWKQHKSVVLVIEYQSQNVDVPINLGKTLTVGGDELTVKYYELDMGDPINENPLEWNLNEIVETVSYTHDDQNQTLTASGAGAGNNVLYNGTYKYKRVGNALMFSYPASDGEEAKDPSYYTQE